METLVFLFAPYFLMLFLMLVGVLFYYTEKCNHKFLWGLVFPLIGWLFTVTTFFRGSQLIYFIMLIIIETFRLKDRRRIHGYENHSVRHKTRLIRLKKVLILTVLAGVLFSGYGAIRNFYSAPEQKVEMDTFGIHHS